LRAGSFLLPRPDGGGVERSETEGVLMDGGDFAVVRDLEEAPSVFGCAESTSPVPPWADLRQTGEEKDPSVSAFGGSTSPRGRGEGQEGSAALR